jgi:hypothetical protein
MAEAPLRPYAPARFEYRIWGDAFADLPTPDAVPASAEVYLLPTAVDGVNAKIRGGTLEIKRLLGVRAGLQEWLPELRCRLPLPAAVIECELCPALGIRPPRLAQASYELEPLLEALASAGPGLRCVRLVKRRRPFELASARAERTRVDVSTLTIESVAIEAEAFDAARQAVTELQLTRAPNLDYVAALRRLLPASGSTPGTASAISLSRSAARHPPSEIFAAWSR